MQDGRACDQVLLEGGQEVEGASVGDLLARLQPLLTAQADARAELCGQVDGITL